MSVDPPASAQPTDTTAGGADKIGNLKSFKKGKDLKDINVLRISPTIARQELLSYVRMLIRDCFQGQLPDPFIHMDHGGDLTTPARFWVNTLGGMAKPTFTFTKARLMGQSIPELYPELKRLMVHYWLHREGQPAGDGVQEDSPAFLEKLVYIESHADPRFVRLDVATQPQDDVLSEKRSDSQQFVDAWLGTLSTADLALLFARNEGLTSDERRLRQGLHAAFEAHHARHLRTLPSRLHFSAPPNQMIRRRAEEAHAARPDK